LEKFFRQAIENFYEFFSSLDVTRKVGIFALAGITISIMIAVVIWAGKTRYKVLYADLNQDDSTQVARLLKESNISYQFEDDGKNNTGS
jgi:flagellar M-ring protein FliF